MPFRIVTDDDGTRHRDFYTDPNGTDHHVIITGPATGIVTTEDGTDYDVTAEAIQCRPDHVEELKGLIFGTK